jgi:hypothetical protein
MTRLAVSDDQPKLSRQQASHLARRLKRHQRHLIEGIQQESNCKICYPPSKSLERNPNSGSGEPSQSAPSVHSVVPTRPVDDWTLRAEQCARIDLSAEETAQLLGMDVPTFEAKVAEHYHFSWAQIRDRARLQERVELHDAAGKAAKRGDWRPFLSLFKLGLIRTSIVPKDARQNIDISQRIKELDQRIASLRNAKPAEGISTEMLA